MGPVIRFVRWAMYLPIFFASFPCRMQIFSVGWSRPVCYWASCVCMNLIHSPHSLSHHLIWVFLYLIHLGQEPIQDLFIVWPCCQMAMHWVWSWAIITFILSLKMICSFSVSRWIIAWSSLGSVIRHCFSFALIRWHNVILQFNVTCAGGFLCPSF